MLDIVDAVCVGRVDGVDQRCTVPATVQSNLPTAQGGASAEGTNAPRGVKQSKPIHIYLPPTLGTLLWKEALSSAPAFVPSFCTVIMYHHAATIPSYTSPSRIAFLWQWVCAVPQMPCTTPLRGRITCTPICLTYKTLETAHQSQFIISS